MFGPYKLKLPLGRDYNVDLDDSLKAKKTFKDLGYYRTPSYGMTPYPDEPLFEAIENFQSDLDLRRDGVMKPEGETATALGEVVGVARQLKDDPASSSLLAAKSEGNGKKCYGRWKREHAKCYKWAPYGVNVVRGCMGRANDRLRLCYRHGYPEPRDVKPWGPKDMM